MFFSKFLLNTEEHFANLLKKKEIKWAFYLYSLICLLSIPYSFYLFNPSIPLPLTISILITILSIILLSNTFFIAISFLINFFIAYFVFFQNQGINYLNNIGLQNFFISGTLIYPLLIIIIVISILIYKLKSNIATKEALLKQEELIAKLKILEARIQTTGFTIEEMQAEKISQLYRLAEFGRLSSGIFHDLINPLTAISLNLELINCQEDVRFETTKDCLRQALEASSKMEDLIGSIKKSINQESVSKNFSFFRECQNSLRFLNYQALRVGAKIKLVGDKTLYINGDSLKFNQIITNLVANSIDACQANRLKIDKLITISIKRAKNFGVIKISDNGIGINPKNIDKIFQPFFTTKEKRGLGLGLSSTRSLIEKDFKGLIKVYSQRCKKTVFIVKIPLLQE